MRRPAKQKITDEKTKLLLFEIQKVKSIIKTTSEDMAKKIDLVLAIAISVASQVH